MAIKKKNKLLLATWACENKNYASYQLWYGSLKNIFNEIILFDPQKNIYLYGQDGMNNKFLEILVKEKPDYLFLWLHSDEFYIETLLKIRKILPMIKIINLFGDDDTMFNHFTKYYALFFDGCLLFPQLDKDIYEKNGILNYFYTCVVNTDIFKPLDLKKTYDVTFCGTSNNFRYELVKCLLKRGVNIKVFGGGWNNYNDIKNSYGGNMNFKKLVEIINKSKINLGLTKNVYGEPHLKGKIFEIGACRAFVLAENSPGY